MEYTSSRRRPIRAGKEGARYLLNAAGVRENVAHVGHFLGDNLTLKDNSCTLIDVNRVADVVCSMLPLSGNGDPNGEIAVGQEAKKASGTCQLQRGVTRGTPTPGQF